MRNAVAVDAGFDQVKEGARTKVEEERVVGFDQITGGGSGGMDVCARSQYGDPDHDTVAS